MAKQREWFLEMECTPSKDAMKIVEVTTKGLEYYKHLVDQGEAGPERTDSNFKRTSTTVKMLSDNTAMLERNHS